MDYTELVKSLRYEASYAYLGSEEKRLSQMMREAANAIEELQRRCEQFQYMPPPAWIPVTERLPEQDENVFVYSKYSGLMYVDANPQFHRNITHWMPLPAPPKEET